MDAMALIGYAATIALVGILLWYVIEFLPIPSTMKRVAQLLLVVILLLDVLSHVAGARPLSSGLVPLRPSSPSNPSTVR